MKTNGMQRMLSSMNKSELLRSVFLSPVFKKSDEVRQENGGQENESGESRLFVSRMYEMSCGIIGETHLLQSSDNSWEFRPKPLVSPVDSPLHFPCTGVKG